MLQDDSHRFRDSFVDAETGQVWFACPCCGLPTLSERGAFDVCCVCGWEDDGQGDLNADEVCGGPNGRYSLSQARLNFRRYMSMYDAKDPAAIEPTYIMAAAKTSLASAFAALSGASEVNRRTVWTTINVAKRQIHQELLRRRST